MPDMEQSVRDGARKKWVASKQHPPEGRPCLDGKRAVEDPVERMLVLAGCRHGQDKGGVELAPGRLLTFCTLTDALVDPFTPGDRELQAGEAEEIKIPINEAAILRPRAVARLNRRLCEAIHAGGAAYVAQGVLPKILTLGGDHSIAIGSISAISDLLAEHHHRHAGKVEMAFSDPRPVVFWVDAHADINTPRTTASGKLHGCPVSLLTGIDEEGWSHLPDFDWVGERRERRPVEAGRNFVERAKLVYIATRDVDPPEREIIAREGILEYSMAAIRARQRDLRTILAEALRQVDPKGEHPIHISFDIDSLDPTLAASTGTPVPGGLTVEEGELIIGALRETGRLGSMDLVEVNLSLGTAEEAEQTLQSAARLIRAFHI